LFCNLLSRPRYQLEFKGRNTFFELWAAGLVFAVANIAVLAAVVRGFDKAAAA
jgi:hypothetical protein